MKRFWQNIVRFRLVLTVISIAALIVTLWLQSVAPGGTLVRPTQMPAETAATLQDKLTEAAQGTRVFKVNAEITEDDSTVKGALPASTESSGAHAVNINPRATVTDAMKTPTVQSGQVSSLQKSSTTFSAEQGLLNGLTNNPGTGVGK